MCDDSFKTMVYSFIQSGLNIMVLHVVSRPESICLPTSNGSSKSVSRGKTILLSDYLLQRIDDFMFDNLFVDQH
jgi:thiamine biosynthesis protein ThiC